MLDGRDPQNLEWEVHAGGLSILDAVEGALELGQVHLATSRYVLSRFGNMSSDTLMFVLAEMMAAPRCAEGVAMAFGPGLATEGFGFSHTTV